MTAHPRTVVVTGAATGIGAAIARRFARAGDQIALLDINEAGAKALASELEALGVRCLAVRCDVTDPEQCQAAIAAAIDHFDGIDVLVNNAGITHLGRFIDTDTSVLRRVMEVNFFGAVECTKAALPALIEAHGQIIALSSVAGFAPLATRTGYAASKHALHGFYDSLRAELFDDGVGVTLVCPYFVNTSIGDRALGPDGRTASAGARTGVRDSIEPGEVAEAIYQGVERNLALVLVPGRSRLAWWVSRLAPRLYARLMRRQFRR